MDMDSNSWSIAVPLISAVSALIGATIGGSISIYVSRQNRKSEVDRWLRKEKMEIYNNILHFFDEQSEASDDPRNEVDEPSFHNQISRILTRARLLCPKEVVDQVEDSGLKLLDFAHNEYDFKNRREYLDAYREAIKKLRMLMLEDLKLS